MTEVLTTSIIAYAKWWLYKLYHITKLLYSCMLY